MTAARPRLHLARIEPGGYLAAIRAGLGWTNAAALLRARARVLIKPNLTFPTFRPGVMTNPECIEALLIALKDFDVDVTIGEADSGGYNRFSMTEVFDAIGLKQLASRYGVRLVNFSELPAQPLHVDAGWRRVSVPLPAMLREIDAFVTMPVPKVHANAGVSLGLKNQWGLITSPAERLKLHPAFRHVIHAIARVLPPTLSVVDGQFGLTRNGPMRGDVVRLGWVAVGDNIYATDFAVCQLMGIDPRTVGYLWPILRQERVSSAEQIDVNTTLAPFTAPEPFYVRRAWTDLPGFATFHSRFLAWVGYESALAPSLHRLLYRFREPFY